jgi:hypothetical protein
VQVVRLDLRAEVRLTPDDLLAVAAAPALLYDPSLHSVHPARKHWCAAS